MGPGRSSPCYQSAKDCLSPANACHPLLDTLSTDHLQMFDDRPERQCRDECQRADQQDRADEHHHEQRSVRRQCAGAGGVYFFRASEPAIASVGIISQ